MKKPHKFLVRLEQIARALDRLAPPPPPVPSLEGADAFVWTPALPKLEPVPQVSRVDVSLLKGIDLQRDTLLNNTRRFADGLPANNALLWGARGTGKSSLVKAIHAAVCLQRPRSLALIEIHRDDIPTLPDLLRVLRAQPRRCLLFCDDLSFEGADQSYKSLKAVLDGGIEGRPANVLFYATSNRRHLLARDMIENERSTAIHPGEVIEEKVSLSDRFGLWLGFHNLDQETYLTIIDGYISAYDLQVAPDVWRPKAIAWAAGRGARSGRVAWQFIQDLAGELGKRIPA